MARKSWQELPSGPDWTDVILLMKALENLHSVLVTITIGATVHDGPGGYTCIAALHQPEEASVLGQPIVALSAEWPCREHKELVGCLFAGLYELDSMLSKKLWDQNTMPLA